MNTRLITLLAVAALGFVTTASAEVPGAFTARYQVTQSGQPMGTATITLRAGDHGTWVLTKDSEGTGGLAALLGASTHETSTFRWQGAVPAAISYDYRARIAGKKKQRTLRVDAASNTVTVDEGKEPNTYAAAPGLVERNTLPLALGAALAGGQTTLTLPVAVRQKVETERFTVTGRETITVPAGTFPAQRVERSDADKDFAAWYVPNRYPLPVKITQRDGGDLTLELVSYSAP